MKHTLKQIKNTSLTIASIYIFICSIAYAQTPKFESIPQGLPGYTSLASNRVNDVWVSSDSKSIYVATTAGVSFSHDGGQTFATSTVSNGLDTNVVLKVNGHPTNQNIALVQTAFAKNRFLTTDGGKTFTLNNKLNFVDPNVCSCSGCNHNEQMVTQVVPTKSTPYAHVQRYAQNAIKYPFYVAGQSIDRKGMLFFPIQHASGECQDYAVLSRFIQMNYCGALPSSFSQQCQFDQYGIPLQSNVHLKYPFSSGQTGFYGSVFSDWSVHSMLRYGNYLYVATTQGLKKIKVTNKFELTGSVINLLELKNDDVRGFTIVVEGNKNRIYASTQRGVVVVNLSGDHVKTIATDPDSITNFDVNSVNESDEGTLLLVSTTNGTYITKNKGESFLLVPSTKGTNVRRSWLIDAELYISVIESGSNGWKDNFGPFLKVDDITSTQVPQKVEFTSIANVPYVNDLKKFGTALYAATSKGIAVSVNGGDSFKHTGYWKFSSQTTTNTPVAFTQLADDGSGNVAAATENAGILFLNYQLDLIRSDSIYSFDPQSKTFQHESGKGQSVLISTQIGWLNVVNKTFRSGQQPYRAFYQGYKTKWHYDLSIDTLVGHSFYDMDSNDSLTFIAGALTTLQVHKVNEKKIQSHNLFPWNPYLQISSLDAMNFQGTQGTVLFVVTGSDVPNPSNLLLRGTFQ